MTSIAQPSARIKSDEVDAAAQRDARDAIMQIPPFPELQTRLTRVFGPGPERDMVHQLVYWYRKPKMQNRWTLYKTYEEWREERGLNRKQVDKARRRLKVHPSGVVTEKRGQYKRIHYRIDWVALADLLLIPLKGVQIEEWDDDSLDCEEESNLTPPRGVQFQSDPPKGGTVQSDPPQQALRPIPMPQTPPQGGYSPTQENTQENTYRIILSYREARNPLSRNPRRPK
jgi:hypothetical protein